MKGAIEHARGLVWKAENDLRIAELGVEHKTSLDMVCFHLQQAVEKLLKAALTCRDVDYPPTHDLMALMDLAEPHYPGLKTFRSLLPGLSRYAVRIRYDPSLYPGLDEVWAARDTANRFRDSMYKLLPPETLRPGPS